MAGTGAPSSAWAAAAKPRALALNAITSSAPAMARRRNPTGVVPAVLLASWIWFVFGEVFMALIVHPAKAAQ